MDWAIFSQTGFEFIFRWIHFLSGITWIGMLYYMNFAQGGFFNSTTPQAKVAAQTGLLPVVLWWFRWGAMFTFGTGWIMILYKGHVAGHEIYTTSWGLMILSGGLIGTTMWANVWFRIWPLQKIVIASAESVAKGGQPLPEAAAAGAKAALASRHNVLFSFPMLFFMGAASHLPLSMERGAGLWWAVFSVAMIALEFNALKGKLGPMTTVKGVIHMGVALTVVFYILAEILT